MFLFSFDYYPYESYSIRRVLSLRVSPIAHDDGFLLKSVSFMLALHNLDDVMWTGTEFGLMGYALPPPLQGKTVAEDQSKKSAKKR